MISRCNSKSENQIIPKLRGARDGYLCVNMRQQIETNLHLLTPLLEHRIAALIELASMRATQILNDWNETWDPANLRFGGQAWLCWCDNKSVHMHPNETVALILNLCFFVCGHIFLLPSRYKRNNLMLTRNERCNRFLWSVEVVERLTVRPISEWLAGHQLGASSSTGSDSLNLWPKEARIWNKPGVELWLLEWCRVMLTLTPIPSSSFLEVHLIPKTDRIRRPILQVGCLLIKIHLSSLRFQLHLTIC